MGKSAIILGGGIAGLASAVFLAKEGFNVSLYEASPKWGGRTYSYYDKGKNIYADNGKHILAGWYENTFDYLKIIGAFNKLRFKDNLDLFFIDSNKKSYKFKCISLPGIYSLLSGVFRFKGFNFNDKIKFLKIRSLLNKNKFDREYLKSANVLELLDKLQQTMNLRKFFWYPLILASFNTFPENVCADLFVKLIKKGTEKRKNMSIILSDENLNDLFINDAIAYLKKKSASLNLSLGCSKINLEGNKIKNIELENGQIVSGDYYISAVPYNNIDKLFSEDVSEKYLNNSNKLKPSAIVSVHLFFKEEIGKELNNEMTGMLDTTVQWAFKVNKKQLCLVISGADFIEGNLTEKTNEEIYKICIKDLKSCIREFDENKISDYKIIKEKRATFLPETGSENFRLNQKSDIENFYIAGDWTNTGYPATIESAVKSAGICTELIKSNN